MTSRVDFCFVSGLSGVFALAVCACALPIWRTLRCAVGRASLTPPRVLSYLKGTAHTARPTAALPLSPCALLAFFRPLGAWLNAAGRRSLVRCGQGQGLRPARLRGVACAALPCLRALLLGRYLASFARAWFFFCWCCRNLYPR